MYSLGSTSSPPPRRARTSALPCPTPRDCTYSTSPPAVTRVQRLGQPGSAEVPVGTDLARNGPQVVVEVIDRRAAPEPVAVVDAVDDEPRLEHERVRDHRVVLGVGVLLEVELLLDDAPR